MTKMRVAFVVQRYGAEVNGGAETLCRMVAERMTRHWDIDVLTSCALDYVTWADHFPEGVQNENGVTVRRFPVAHPRDIDAFNELSRELCGEERPRLEAQEEWMRAQGPWCPALLQYISDNLDRYDLVIFFGYLYATSYFGVGLAGGKAVLVPFAHDEWPIHFSMWDAKFSQPSLFVFSTPEEKAFLQRRFPNVDFAGPTIGVAVERPARIDPRRLREQHGLTGDFVLYVGRVDPSKGCSLMFDYFTRHVAETGDPTQLVTLGRAVMEIPDHPQIRPLGFVSEESKWDAMAACDVLIMPSPYESLSIVLLEAWAVGKPVLVNEQSEVLRGQVRRSNGGLVFASYEEFCASLDLLRTTGAANVLGRQGWEFVNAHYRWDVIEKAYIDLAAAMVPRRDSETVAAAADVPAEPSGNLPPAIDPRLNQPALELPEGQTYEGLFRTLTSFAIHTGESADTASTGGELANYVSEDYERFLRTLWLVPRGPLDVLEIGANPYFTSYLIRKFRPEARLSLANSFGGRQEQRVQVLTLENESGGRDKFVFEFTNTNVETMRLPYEDASFDVVLFCEVIEHLVEDPVRAILELKRVLTPSGLMVLTTPNVARLENVARMVAGANVYDPYSGYGVYGRHNREYSKHELWRLMTFCGFAVQHLFTADVHENRASNYGDVSPLEPLLRFRAPDLGQYIFSTWLNDGPAPSKVPGWLYRSLPTDRIDPEPL